MTEGNKNLCADTCAASTPERSAKLETRAERFTKGPLSHSPQDGEPGHCTMAQVWHPDGGALADIEPTRGGIEASANAALFAAAPDLYAACAEFVRKVECGEARSTASYEQMKAALAKATGTVTSSARAHGTNDRAEEELK